MSKTNPAPGQVWWNPRLQRYAVVYDVWVKVARVILLSPNHLRPPRSTTWHDGPPEGWGQLPYYEPPERKP